MRAVLVLVLVAATVAGCASVSAPSAPSSPLPADDHGAHAAGDSGGPATPHPSVPESADGSIELVSDFAFGGGGVTAAQALEVASSQPVLLTGILLRDTDGSVWFCDELDDQASPPACAAPRLVVVNLTETAVFEPANAESSGARTEAGVSWVEEHQLFGVVHPAP